MGNTQGLKIDIHEKYIQKELEWHAEEINTSLF